MRAFFSLFLAVDMWKYTLLQNVVHQVTTERIGPSESEPDSSEVFCFFLWSKWNTVSWIDGQYREVLLISDILAKQAYYCIEWFLW